MVRPTTPEESYLATTDGTLETYDTVLRADNNGFLITGNDLPGERKKIIVLGDSFVESYWAPWETERWVAVAERQLEVLAPGKFHVMNGGYSGATSLHMALSVPSKLRALFEDTAGVVLFMPTNDAVVSKLQHTFWTKNKYWSPLTPFDHPGDLPDVRFDAKLDIRANWLNMLNYLKIYNIPTIVATTPVRTGKCSDDSFITKKFSNDEKYLEWKNANYSMMDDVLNLAKEFGARTLDVREFDWPEGGSYPLYYDHLHLNDKGQVYFGNKFANEIFATKFWEDSVQ